MIVRDLPPPTAWITKSTLDALPKYKHELCSMVIPGHRAEQHVGIYTEDQVLELVRDLRQLLQNYQTPAADHSHRCRKCAHPYTPDHGQSEDCPLCGHDGSPM